MGKKKEKLRHLFKESIDPRFSGVFNYNKNPNILESSSKIAQPLVNEAAEYNYPTGRENVGFQNFISTKLAAFLDSHMKEVDRPVSEQDFFINKRESMQLFSDSDAITEEIIESIQKKREKKKRKKDKSDKELLKEVAVDFDWLQRQAQLLKS